MFKKLTKFSIYSLLIISVLILYLSYFGVSTERFNYIIQNKILETNQKLKIDLKSVKILLDPFNLSINLKTFDTKLIFNSKEFKLKEIGTNFSLLSLLNKKFSIDDLQLVTKENKLKDIITLIRLYKNTPQLFIFEKFVKKGFVTAKINLNFDEQGKVLDDFKIKGNAKDIKINLLSNKNFNNLNFNFEIKNKEYLLTEIKSKYNDLKFSSKLIKVIKKKNQFYIEGDIINNDPNINEGLISLLPELYIKNIDKNSLNLNIESKFSFLIDKKFKFKDLKIKSKVNLNNLVYNYKYLKLKNYFPKFKNKIQVKDHLIEFIYAKNNFEISGKGKILISDKFDNVKYTIVKKNSDYKFSSDINLKNNILVLNQLNYIKDENLNSFLKFEGLYNEKSGIKFNFISLEENNNNFLVEDLDLNKNFKINQVKFINLNFINNEKIENKIFIKKNKKNYLLSGKVFDASSLIDQMLESDDNTGLATLLNNFSSTINVKINKTYLDNENYINDLSGKIIFTNSKIKNVDLKSNFSRNKILTFTIVTNRNNEKVTTFYSDFAKPLVKKYKFIKGFEEGILDFHSVKKNNFSESKLKIYDFKLKELPVLTKILTLASLQGIADILTGEGIRFNEFEMNFSNKDNLMEIYEIYAIGPAISILMEGYIESKKLISLKGTLVPATTINKAIGSIPILGNILVGKKTGEGVFGVSFKIKGPPKDLKTTVNPIKTLTPRFITRTLEKIKKTN